MTFEEYVGARGPVLLRFAAVLTGDRGLAEDVLQEVLSRAYSRWDRVGTVEDPHAYVRRMIVNEYLSWRRKWQRVSPVAEMDDLMPPAPDHATGQVERAELLEGLASLPRAQRAAIVLRYYEGLPDGEVAAALGTGTSAVRSNIARGLRRLRIDLGEAKATERMLEGRQS